MTRLAGGVTVGGVGGIDPDQRRGPNYHRLAFISEEAVLALATRFKPVDLLITHQGPTVTQGTFGAGLLDLLAERAAARAWFHGHSVRNDAIVKAGPGDGATIVPLHDVAFPIAGPDQGRPGTSGWAWVTVGAGEVVIDRRAPAWLGSFRRSLWVETTDGLLVCPPLAGVAWQLRHQEPE